MKRKIEIILLIFVLFCSTMITGCSKKSMDPNEVTDFLKNLDSYTASTNIEIRNDKQTINYECNQLYKKDTGYRLEINKDRVMIYKNNKIYINDIKNNTKYTANGDFDNLYRLSFVGEYINLLYTEESIKYSYKMINGRKILLIKLIIPGGSREINNAVMYVDNKSCIPEKLMIFDNNGKEKVIVDYKKFIPDAEISSDLFKE